MHRAPIDVSWQLRNGLFEKLDTAVLTSATLRTYGGFEFMRRRLGLPPSAQEIALDSSFDYLSQALCILPSDIPPYDDNRYDSYLAGAVADCARRLGGRTLALFTGYTALRRIADDIERRLAGEGIAVLAQGIDGSRRQLIESFTASDRTVLCGTSSFWEGIDIPGDALQCVVIAKLPFPVPTDPVVAARSEHLSDPFGQYALPLAVLRLRQGFGRLIRRAKDRGTVVIADSRLRDRRYAAAFLDALPECGFARVPARDVGDLTERFVRDGTVPEATIPVRGERQWDEEWLQTSLPGSDEPA
jgi:DNA polymerase-3 subunit epsilon/ATP-dependent DNA helicase DinG